MAQTKRAQVMMDPDEYDQLQEIACLRGTSVGELFRDAVRRCYLPHAAERLRIVEELTSMRVPLPPWDELKAEIEGSYDRGA